MSAHAPEIDTAPTRPLPLPRTRLQPVGGQGKSLYLAALLLSLSLLAALFARSFSKGATAYIHTNAPRAVLSVDNSVATTASDAGSAQFNSLPFGFRNLDIKDRDHEPLSTAFRLGWLSSNRFAFELKPIPLTLTINTHPGAEVTLNGQSHGTANPEGVFQETGVLPGDYTIQVSLSGFEPVSIRRHLSPNHEHFNAWLRVSQARIRQQQEEARRAQENAAKFQQSLLSAQQLFNSRQYQAALSSVDQALTLMPDNPTAQQLRARIVQTINILK